MKRKQIRIIIDTNLWISFLIGKKLNNLKDLIVKEQIKLLICTELLDEIKRVTLKPKLKKYFPINKVDELIDFMKIIGESIEIKHETTTCRDPKDNYLLSLAKDGKANYLLTGDKDLLEIGKYYKTEIIDISAFEKIK